MSNLFKQTHVYWNESALCISSGAMHNALHLQKQHIAWLDNELKAILNIPDQILRRRNRLQLGKLLTFFNDPIKSPSLIDLFYAAMQNNPGYQNFVKFTQQNQKTLLIIIDVMKQRLRELSNLADEMLQPAPWRRYTKYSYTMHKILDFESQIMHMLHA